MKNTVAAIMIMGALLAGCATPGPRATPAPTPAEVAVEPTATAPPTSTPVPSATPTIAPLDESCVRATTEIPEGQNPTHFLNFGPPNGCYDSVGAFLDDIGLTWEEFVAGTVVTLWTVWPLDSHGAPIAPTPTPVPIYTLSGTVFFDYNGNGMRDQGEPPIEGVPIRVAGLTTTSAPDGSYSLAAVPAGTQQIHVESPTQDPATAFRYINRFLGWVDLPAYEMNGVSVPAQHLADTEVQPIDQALRMAVRGDQSLDVALMQGFLTLPFRCQDAFKIFEYHGFDHDARVGFVMDYRGDSTVSSAPGDPGTGDQHEGDDFGVPQGTFIVAPMPGMMTHEFVNPDNAARVARVADPRLVDRPGYYVVVLFGHHSVPLVKNVPTELTEQGPEVNRGQILAVSGMTGTGWPHLHLSCNQHPLPSHAEDFRCYDTYGVSFTPENTLDKNSARTVYNNPQCYP